MILIVKVVLMMENQKAKRRKNLEFMCHPNLPLSIMVSTVSFTSSYITHKAATQASSFSFMQDGDETPMTRQQKQLERAKKRALQSSVMQELREEYMDTPTEISQASATQTVLSRQHREKEE